MSLACIMSDLLDMHVLQIDRDIQSLEAELDVLPPPSPPPFLTSIVVFIVLWLPERTSFVQLSGVLHSNMVGRVIFLSNPGKELGDGFLHIPLQNLEMLERT